MSTSARRLLLYGDLAELKRLAIWLKGWATQDLSANLSFAVQVCLEEAVANIIMYSTTTDDPTQVLRPPVPASLAEAKVGNLGIHLMRSFASGMQYERCDSRNRLTIRFVEVQDAAHRVTMR